MCEAIIKQMWSASQNLHMKLSNRELFIFNPWVGKIPWRRERLPTPVFWPGEFHRRYSPWGCKASDMTERLSLIFKKKKNFTLKFKTVTLMPFLALLGSINFFACTSLPHFQGLKPLYFLRLYQARGWNWGQDDKGTVWQALASYETYMCTPITVPLKLPPVTFRSS